MTSLSNRTAHEIHCTTVVMVLADMYQICVKLSSSTALPAKSDSDVMFCLQSYQGLLIDRLLVF